MKYLDNIEFIAQVELGYSRVSVYIQNGNSGYFILLPDDDETPQLVVGIHAKSMDLVLDVYLHEVIEFLMTMTHARYRATVDLTAGHDGYLFVMDHPQFTRVVHDATDGLNDIIDILRAKWHEYNSDVDIT